jgi:hypothetical protein
MSSQSTGDDEAVVSIEYRRIISDGHGREWLVREIENQAYDRRDSRSLIFERSDIVRRLRTFPRTWPAMSDDELFVLSEQRG